MGQLFSDAMASLGREHPPAKRPRVAQDVERVVKDEGFALKATNFAHDEDSNDDMSSTSDRSSDEDDLAIAALESYRKPEPKPEPGLGYGKMC